MMNRRLPIATPAHTRAYILTLLGRHRVRFFVTMLFSVTAAASAMVAPYLVGRMTENFADWGQGFGADPGGDLTWQMCTILAAVLAQAALTWAAYRNLTALNEQIAAEIREEFLEHTLRLPPGQIEGAGTGELLARTSLDVEQVQQSIIHAVPQFFTGLVTVLVYLVGAFIVSPVLGTAILVAVPPIALVLRWYFKRASAIFHATQAARSDLTVVVTETIDGIRTVESLGWQARRVELTDQAIERLLSAQRKTIGIRRVLVPILDFSAFLPCFTVLFLGGVLTATGAISLSDTTTVVLIMYLAVAPAVEMVHSLAFMQGGSVSLARLVGVQIERTEQADARPQPDAEEIIQVKGVEFGYSSDRRVLHGVDLELRRGERLALVGPTGAGKSTLAKLMVGFHRPDRGVVLIGGTQAEDIDTAAIRRFVVIVTQEYHLFNDSLASNLRLGSAEADDTELREALEAVGAGDLLRKLPDGLETRVGGRDYKLTSAEVQQVALARVVLADPEVIVLDEATSMMSPSSASTIEKGFNRILDDRTVVSIAHRLNTAHDADRVAVVDQGCITELGTHTELVDRNGTYAALWRRWHE